MPVDRQIGQVQRRVEGHEQRLSKLEIHSAAEAVRNQSIEAKLASIQDDLKWVLRLILGGIIAGAVTYMMQGGFNVA